MLTTCPLIYSSALLYIRNVREWLKKLSLYTVTRERERDRETEIENRRKRSFTARFRE